MTIGTVGIARQLILDELMRDVKRVMARCGRVLRAVVLATVLPAPAVVLAASTPQSFYVNPNTGNDANAGTAPAAAWATAGRLNQALGNGTIAGAAWPWTSAANGVAVPQTTSEAELLAGVESGAIVFGAGSTIYIDTSGGAWTMDQGINLSGKSGVRLVGVGASGSPADLRVFKVVAPSSWVPVIGTTHVYCTTDTEADAVVWEDRKWLNHPLGANLAAVRSALESMPGSFWTDGVFLYVHPFGDTNPASDGKFYERSRYLSGGVHGCAVGLLNSPNCWVENLSIGGMTMVKPDTASPGGLTNDNYQIYCEANRQVIKNCRTYYSNKHGIGQISGASGLWALITDCQATQGNRYAGTGGQTPFVSFTGAGTGLVCHYLRCTTPAADGAIGSTAGRSSVGLHPAFYIHTVGGTFAEVSLTDSDFRADEIGGELNISLHGVKANRVTVPTCTADGCSFSGLGPTSNATVTNSIFRSNDLNYTSNPGLTGTIVYDACTFDAGLVPGNGYTGLLSPTPSGAVDITIKNSVFIAPSTGPDVMLLATSGTNLAATGTRKLTMANNVYRPGPGGSIVHYENNFAGNYYLSAAGLAGEGCDIGSVVADPGLDSLYRPQYGSATVGRAGGTLNNQDYTGATFATRMTSGAYEFNPTFAQWQAARFPDPAQRADPAIGASAADPDGNGLSNLLEYAFGVSPSVPPANASTLPPSPQMSQARLAMTYRALPSAADLLYQPEVSADLLTWQGGAAAVETVGTVDLGGGVNAVTVRAVAPPAGSPPRLFMRLRVTQQ